ncbi:MAG TPA: heavy metal-associated domain-containing protein [Kofleriaceae bacterium]|nr:heavy metal-associated domain-containing protein [Kofleriaceae bacterium]
MITTLRIAGMSCNNCVRHVGDALRAVPGVTAVEVSLPERRATVTHGDVAGADLVAAVESAGYEAAA